MAIADLAVTYLKDELGTDYVINNAALGMQDENTNVYSFLKQQFLNAITQTLGATFETPDATHSYNYSLTSLDQFVSSGYSIAHVADIKLTGKYADAATLDAQIEAMYDSSALQGHDFVSLNNVSITSGEAEDGEYTADFMYVVTCPANTDLNAQADGTLPKSSYVLIADTSQAGRGRQYLSGAKGEVVDVDIVVFTFDTNNMNTTRDAVRDKLLGWVPNDPSINYDQLEYQDQEFEQLGTQTKLRCNRLTFQTYGLFRGS